MTLLPIITGKVELTAQMYSDSWRSYDGLVGLGYAKHYRVNHGNNEFAFKNQDGATVNGIESFWSFTKRRPSTSLMATPSTLIYTSKSVNGDGIVPN